MEELETEGDDTDTHGVGLPVRRNTRFVSDSLQFTGIDMGDRKSGTSRRRQYSDSEDDDGDSTSNESDSDDDEDSDDSDYLDLSHLSPEQREEVLVQSAMRRISQAQAAGQANVDLKKDEIEALERRRKRIEEEERAKRKKKKRHSESGSDRKKKSREQRIAVPLTQLAPVSRKKKSSLSSSTEFPPRQDSLPRQIAAGDLPPDGRDRQGYPPIGYFPPPSASRSRPRAGTTSSQRPPSRARDEYEYSSSRPSSANRPRSSRGSPRDEASMLSSRSSHLDPFQFQTAGPRVPPHPAGAAAASSRRHVSNPSDIIYEQRRGMVTPAAARSRHGSRRPSYEEDTSEAESSSSEASTSDDRGGAQIREPVSKSRARGRNSTIVVEESPERVKSKKKSSSPVKRKPVGGKKKKK